MSCARDSLGMLLVPSKDQLKPLKIFFFIFVLLYSGGLASQAFPKKERNVIGLDRKNQTFIIKNWPLGNTVETASLLINFEYILVPHSGVVVAENYDRAVGEIHSTYFNQPMVISARLPDLKPLAARSPNGSYDDAKDADITISFSPTAMSEKKENFLIHALYEFNNPFVVRKWQKEKYSLKFGHKPSRFGLDRLGPIGNFEPFKQDTAVNDLLFSIENPKSVVLICPAEEIKDAAEDATWQQRPICTHYFFSSSLKALVKLTYRRTYLHDWKEIQNKTETLLASFKQ